MRSITRKGFVSLLAIAILAGFSLPVMADTFPSKPVTFIIPYPAGGSTDVTMRALAETTAKYLGQPIVVENRPGAGGTIGGATMAASAKPDGYTVSQIPTGIFRYPHMMKVSWDPLKDFTYIIHVTAYTFGVVVKNDAPWKTFKEFMAYAKANPGKVKLANSGMGAAPHVTMERLALTQGIKWVQVPTKGVAESTAMIMGGHVMATADSTGWGAQVDSGALRLLVTWGNGKHRTKRWPNVPTLQELGYGPGTGSPFGIAGPKGMDPRVVKTLHDAFKKGMEDPAYQKVLDKYDMVPVYMNSRDYTKFVKEWFDNEKEIVEQLGLKKK